MYCTGTGLHQIQRQDYTVRDMIIWPSAEFMDVQFCWFFWAKSWELSDLRFRIETFVPITSKNSASDKDYEKRQNQVTKYKCFQWQKSYMVMKLRKRWTFMVSCCFPPSFRTTKFTKQEIRTMYRGFKQVPKTSFSYLVCTLNRCIRYLLCGT